MDHLPILSDSGTLTHFLNNYVNTWLNMLERGRMIMKLTHILPQIVTLHLMRTILSGVLMMNPKMIVTP